ncbi:MAG: sensor histidine kinase [Gemmatimonadaceae bacterium]
MTDGSSRAALREEMRRCRILLVDDEEANLDLLESLHGADGYHAIERTSDAREAMPLAARSAADLVLLDLHMPHRDGLELLRELRAAAPAGEYRPVLVLTADVTTAARERALALGAHDFLTKPFDAVEVLLRVENLLETRLLYRRQHDARLRAEAAEARSALLAEWSRVLASSLDSSTSLAHLPRLVVPRLADACAVLLRQPGGLVVGGEAAVTPEDAPRWCDLLERAGPSPAGMASSECLVPLPDGRSARLLIAPVRDHLAEVGALVLARAGTTNRFPKADRALLEDLAARAGQAVEHARLFAAAELATRERERLLAVVAHDLRNPLGVVGMYAEMLASMIPPDGDAYSREALGSICRTTARMQELVEDLLDASALQQGGIRVHAGPQDGTALFAEAERMLRPLAAARGIELVVRRRCPAADGEPVVVDGARLLQLLSNLVGNAVKHTPAGGTVTVCWAADGDGLAVEVADDGPGIAERELPHIFTAFWQAHEHDRGGVGLGLWIARAIVEAHGGRIGVASPAGRGATFRFTIPTPAPAPVVTHARAANPGDS